MTNFIGSYSEILCLFFQSALSSIGEELTDNLRVVHQFVDLSEEVVPRYNPITRSFELVSTTYVFELLLLYKNIMGRHEKR